MFLDTSGLLSLLHRAEGQHSAAKDLFFASRRRFTTSYVIAELIALANVRGLPREPVLDFADSLSSDPQIEMIWIGEDLHRAGMDLLRSRGDKEYSLCDAISFVVMRKRRIREALTTDHHFEQEGFRRLLA